MHQAQPSSRVRSGRSHHLAQGSISYWSASMLTLSRLAAPSSSAVSSAHTP